MFMWTDMTLSDMGSELQESVFSVCFMGWENALMDCYQKFEKKKKKRASEREQNRKNTRVHLMQEG